MRPASLGEIGVTLFEYLAIAYSLVISFAVLRVLSGLPHALGTQHRYWIHLAWLCWILQASILEFWIFWGFRDVNWSYGLFLLVLANPALLYVIACILTPEEPSHVASWREHFYAIRLKLFVTAICWRFVLLAITIVILKLPLDHPIFLVHLVSFALWVAGASSKRPTVHATIACIILAAAVFSAFPVLSRPGGIVAIPQ